MSGYAESAYECVEIDFGVHPPAQLRAKECIGGWGGKRHSASNDTGYMHSLLCQLGLPRSRVDTLRFERRSGAASLVVTAGELWNGKEWVMQPLPYGVVPRLVMAHIIHYAVLHRTPVVRLGDSLNATLRGLKIGKGGGRSRMFRQQVQSLVACTISFGFSKGDRPVSFAGRPVRQFDAWTDLADDGRSGWTSTIVLSQDFYDAVVARSVPYQFSDLHALRDSSLAMDVYLWLASRLWRTRNEGERVSWKALNGQFGHEYSEVRNFKAKFKTALWKVLATYTDAQVVLVKGGLLLKKSKPPVDRRVSAIGG